MHKLNATVAAALRRVQTRPQWKPGRALPHLRKRQRKKHLSATTTMEAYNQLITDVVHDPASLAYFYPVGEQQYYAVRGAREARDWLVIFDGQGILETAFPPTNMNEYLNTHGFLCIGTVGELLQL